MTQEISKDVLLEKYCKNGETTAEHVFSRVAKDLASVEKNPGMWRPVFYKAMQDGFIPAGRIMSSAGTDIEATLVNCFVIPVGDSIRESIDNHPGIYPALEEAAETMRRGGGVGYDFSRIRPKGAWVNKTKSYASGPVSYMKVFNVSCETVESAGSRRGAQMGVLRCDHPDIEEFIHAKDTKVLSNFNLSVGVTDKFMLAVENDTDWDLIHEASPSASAIKEDSYTYRTVRARELWGQIAEATFNHGEPGVLFVDAWNKENNLHYCEEISACNPCLAEGTLVSTPRGLIPVEQIVSGDAIATIFGKGTVADAIRTAMQPVSLIKFSDGTDLKATSGHIFHVARDKYFDTDTRLDSLRIGDKVRVSKMLMPHNTLPFGRPFKALSDREYGFIVGIVIGDGCYTKNTAGQVKIACDSKEGDWYSLINKLFCKIGNSSVLKSSNSCVCVTSTEVRKELDKSPLAKGYSHEKFLPLELLNSNPEFLSGFIDGCISTDGNIHMSKTNPMVRVASTSKEHLTSLKRALNFFGIHAKIYENGGTKKAGKTTAIEGRIVTYRHTSYTLAVLGSGIITLHNSVTLSRKRKQDRLQELVKKFVLTGSMWTTTIKSITSCGYENVFDLFEPESDTWITDGIVNRGCGEQPLPPYACCCLGSINLTKCVLSPFNKPKFDWDRLIHLTRTAIRMLDNVLDITYWPLEQQRIEALNKRRIGLGFTGLGDALIMMGIEYDTADGREFAKKVACTMRDNSYRESINLAEEKGVFPLFDTERYLQSKFVRRLPHGIIEGIADSGMRNSHLLSIAPTGTISLAFADNASGGIEPAFTWTYNRKKRMPDGSEKTYPVEDHAYRLFKSMVPEGVKLPAYFRDALSISAGDHLAMLEVVQPYIDSSISKTVNVPADYPFEDFKNLYTHAWKAGLKGLATYRPNDIHGSVLSVSKPEKEIPKNTLERRWEKRPAFPQGCASTTYATKSQTGHYLSIHISKDEKEVPFEVWVSGEGSDPTLSALALVISLIMQISDGRLAKSVLEKLKDYHVRDGEFWEYDPNLTDKKKLFPSQVAYLATVALHTYCDGEGVAIELTGKKCPECGKNALIKKDGCTFCTACGHIGACG